MTYNMRDCGAAALAAVKGERDEARAEVARLRAEVARRAPLMRGCLPRGERLRADLSERQRQYVGLSSLKTSCTLP